MSANHPTKQTKKPKQTIRQANLGGATCEVYRKMADIEANIEAKLQAIEVLINTIRDSVRDSVKNSKPSPPIVIKKKKNTNSTPNNIKRFTPERFTADQFIGFVRDNSHLKKFHDGVERLCVTKSLGRHLWPLDLENNEYKKLQDLCADFNFGCIRNDPSVPTVYIVTSVQVEGEAAEASGPSETAIETSEA